MFGRLMYEERLKELNMSSLAKRQLQWIKCGTQVHGTQNGLSATGGGRPEYSPTGAIIGD